MDKLKAFYKYGIDYDAYFKRISSAIFYEINPIGIKYAMKYKYMMNDIVRLPLVSIDNEHKKRIDTFYDNITQ